MPLLLPVALLTDFQNSFTGRFSNKFPAKQHPTTP